MWHFAYINPLKSFNWFGILSVCVCSVCGLCRHRLHLISPCACLSVSVFHSSCSLRSVIGVWMWQHTASDLQQHVKHQQNKKEADTHTQAHSFVMCVSIHDCLFLSFFYWNSRQKMSMGFLLICSVCRRQLRSSFFPSMCENETHSQSHKCSAFNTLRFIPPRNWRKSIEFTLNYHFPWVWCHFNLYTILQSIKWIEL